MSAEIEDVEFPSETEIETRPVKIISSSFFSFSDFVSSSFKESSSLPSSESGLDLSLSGLEALSIGSVIGADGTFTYSVSSAESIVTVIFF